MTQGNCRAAPEKGLAQAPDSARSSCRLGCRLLILIAAPFSSRLSRYTELDALHKRALRGDKEAAAAFDHLWDDYKDRELECFLCGNEVERPVFTLALPERSDPTKEMAVPLCLAYRALPPMQRLGRALKLLKKMWKGTHFTFKPGQHRRWR
jgi:hypothetical protein